MNHNRDTNKLNPAEWVKKYGDYLYSVALYKLGNSTLSQDMVQDVFLSALKAKDTFLGHSSEKTWLSVILRNKITDYYRKKNTEPSIEDYLETTSENFHNAFFDNSNDKFGHTLESMLPADWGSNADNRVEGKEFSNILKYCISKIPPRIAGIFLSRYFDDKNAMEICNEFNISSSNYWVIIHRAKLLLRSCLEKNWFVK